MKHSKKKTSKQRTYEEWIKHLKYVLMELVVLRIEADYHSLDQKYSMKPPRRLCKFDNACKLQETDNEIGPVAYKLELPEELSNVYSTLHISNLKTCLSDESLVILMKELQLDDKLNFVEEPVEIMDREVKKLKQSRIPIVKVRWNSKRGPEYTWEREDKTRAKYGEKALWVELKRLFEPDKDDVLWKLQRYMHDPLTWRLYGSCGVHHVSSTRGHDVYMLIEKDYPLSTAVMGLMLGINNTNSDYARATQDRKSTTRGCQFLGNRLISWWCKKQTMVATSTTEAEYVAAASYLLTKGFDARRLVMRLELGDRMERAATTASSLEAEQDSGSGPRCQDTILGGVDAQTRFETTSKQSNDPPLLRVNTLGSREDSMKLMELMAHCTKLFELVRKRKERYSEMKTDRELCDKNGKSELVSKKN
ncbi:hypothetical protein Tco_0605482 [Tanacetum coccineum]